MIAPPEDAQLPWSTYPGQPRAVGESRLDIIGMFNDESHAAYAVASANALPGLVEVVEQLDAWSRFGKDPADLNPIIHAARAVLAALPEGVRPS